MKKLVFLLLVLSYGANAQINIDVQNCSYDGRNIHVSLKIENGFNTDQQIEIEDNEYIPQMPYNSRGDEFSHRYYGNIPDAFMLSYVNDTMIKEFKFYGASTPKFLYINIPAKSYVVREYIVYVIGDITRQLLDQKSNEHTLQFF